MNELREKAQEFYDRWQLEDSNIGNTEQYQFTKSEMFDFAIKFRNELIQSQPINKEFGALNKQEKEFEDDSDLHKMRAEIDNFKKEFESEFKRLEALEPSKEPKEFNPFERIKELEKEKERLEKKNVDKRQKLISIKEENDKLKALIKTKDKSSERNYHNYKKYSALYVKSKKQITQLQKKIEKYEDDRRELRLMYDEGEIIVNTRDDADKFESLTNKTDEV